MHKAFQGTSQKRLANLRKAVSAHVAVMQGIATHAEKERVRRERFATSRRATEAISGPFKGTGQSLQSDRPVMRDELLRLLGCGLVGSARLPAGRHLC